MRYLGGKTRNAKAITKILKSYRQDGQGYFEPFCGGLSIASKMEGPMLLNDYHQGLINLYKACKSGEFKYPDKWITRDEYNEHKYNGDRTDPLTTFVGFGLSYAGKWFGGYDAWEDNHNNPGGVTFASARSLKKKFETDIKDAIFESKSYVEFNPKDRLIYCDPPYANTTSYTGVDEFDHEQFWDIMRIWSKSNTVIVSEFNAPDDFVAVWEKPYKVQMCVEQQHVVEKLFIHKDFEIKNNIGLFA